MLLSETLIMVILVAALMLPILYPALMVMKHLYQEEKFFFQRNFRILNELQRHLNQAQDWADPIDLEPWDHTGWNCIQSVRDAVDAGQVGLALTRWDSLLPGNRPILSKEAEEWKQPLNRGRVGFYL